MQAWAANRAGISRLDYLAAFGVAAATVGYDTARIGDGTDMMARGLISHANEPAASLGVSRDQSCRDAADALRQAGQMDRAPPDALEAAFPLISDSPAVLALDSASLVLAEHKDGSVVTGSHGGLLGGRPETVLKYGVRRALRDRARRRRALNLRGRDHPAGSTLMPPFSACETASAPGILSPGCAAPLPHKEEPCPIRCGIDQPAR